MQASQLRGYTVLLNAHYLPGPVAAWLLHQLGARVIKVEPPTGDLLRAAPPFYTAGGRDGRTVSALFAAINADFESIALNLKHPGGIEAFTRLLTRADVYIDGNRPGFVQKIAGREPAEINPGLVFIPITAWGCGGPSFQDAGHDGNCLAAAGTLSYNGTAADGMPAMIGSQVTDIMSGVLAALTALAGLVGRKNPDCQAPLRVYDCAMLDAAMLFNQVYISKHDADGREMAQSGEWLNGGRGYYRIYRTRDGKAVFFAAIEDKLFANFAERTGRADLVRLRRESEDRPEELTAAMGELFASRTLAEWLECLRGCDCCFTPVKTIAQALDDPQVRHRRMVQPVDDPRFGILNRLAYPGLLDGQAVEAGGPVPLLGEHTRAILGELGYDGGQIDALYEQKGVA